MADLQKSQDQWSRFLGREFAACLLSPLRLLQEVEDRFRLARTQVLVINDGNGNVGSAGVTFSGADAGVNLTEEGGAFVRITGSGPYTVSVYTAVGASGLVAQGSGAASSTVILAEQNSSGLTGTWDLPASVTAVADDVLQVLVFVDFALRLKQVFTEDGTVEDDQHSRFAIAQAHAEVAGAIAGARAKVRTAISRWGLRDGTRNPTARGNTYLSANEANVATDTPVGDGSGNVVRKRGGLLVRMASCMEDETSGGEQSVVKRAPTAAAGVFQGGNSGAGTVAGHTPGEQCPASVWTFQCETGTDTGAVGSETFKGYVSFTEDGDDRRENFSGLQVGKQWAGPYGFGPITLARTLSKVGDGSNVNLAAASGCTVSGESGDNTDNGVLSWLVEANALNWDYSFFRSTSNSTTDLVAKATNVVAGAAFTATAQRSSELSVQWTAGGTPVDSTTGTLDLQLFKAVNASEVADEFSVTVTVATNPGLIQTLLAEQFPTGAEINSETAGAETIPDGWAKANTFAPFSVLDN